MGISSLRAWILAASLLSVCAVANAAGLGRLNVMSALGDPLVAEIDLVAEKNEIDSLAARLAGPEAFDRAGLVYSSSLADIKVSIEKRASGEPYIRLTSPQPQNDPFLDLLVELSWASGRVSRQFTALLDPPFLIAEREAQRAAEAEVRAAQSVPAPEAQPMPEPMPETAAASPEDTAPAATESPVEGPATAAEPVSIPDGPVETIGGTAPTLFDATPSVSIAAGDSYGPVKRGDTLSKIARASMPADVSLEQMLVLLFRNNPEAFAGNNMNRLKTGRIIQMPSAEQLASLPEAEARREVRVQAQNWNAYREQLAAAAGQSIPAEDTAQQAAAGKVTTTVEDQGAAAQQPKEVVKLSKGEPAASVAGAPATDSAAAQARVRALEEELVARDKAVKEAGDRVAKLEKTISDLQALLEIKNKGMAELQKPAAPTAPAPAAPSPAAPAATPAPPPAAATPGAEVTPAPAPAPATPAAPKPESEAAPPTTQPAAPKPRPPRPAPMPAPEPSLVDQVVDNLPYVGAGLGVLVLLGALAVRAVKRRRESKSDSEESGPARVGAGFVGAAAGSAYSGTESDITDARAAKDIAEEVDPVAEAEIFMAYGRDGQAEELLKEALAASPGRHEVSLKLLQIYAKRKDTKAFEQTARELQQGTGGSGEVWDQAARLGYQVDPGKPRYAAGRPMGDETGAPDNMSAASNAAENVDFNIGVDDPSATTATDIDLGDSGTDLDKTQIFNPGELSQDGGESEREPVMAMDLNLDLPEPESESRTGGSSIDFEINLDSVPASSEVQPGSEPSAPASGGIDFDMGALSMEPAGEPKVGSGAPEIDLSGISLDLGTETAPQNSPTGKDDHWYDVQTKFDLAKAYQEMGDKDGARDILKEVLQEGDAEQKSAAQAVLASLDS